MDEAELVRLAKNGDLEAFEKLIEQHAKYIYNVALRTVRDPHEAEDLSQEAILKIWKSLPKFRERSQFRTWIYRIVINLTYNRLPKLKKELAALDPDEAEWLTEESSSPEEVVEDNELNEKLHQAIDQLPESYRLLITLRHLNELSYAEIAEVTEQPLGTVKTGIYRARKLLSDTITKHEE